ncbi:hypothetical protein LTR95_008943 [Oleoguttula sp. CCFEE 5521]
MASTEESSNVSVHATPTNATQKFFAIVELVEQVLLYKSVTMENLFVLQRINKTVQGIIRGSQPLQRKMLLALDNKIDIKAPTQYNSIFSMRYLAPGYRNTLPYRSIINGRISAAFGTFTIVLHPHAEGGLVQIRACPLGSSNPCRLGPDKGPASWMVMPIANVPLVAVLHYYGRGLAFLKSGIKQSYDIKTLGDLHQALGNFENRMDCLELPAVKILQSPLLEQPSRDSIMSAPSSHENATGIPAMPTSISAAQRVFAVFELAERILLDIRMKQLFVIQRVNKAFQADIRGSLPLRRIMFLAFEPKPSIRERPRLSGDVFSHVNPISGLGRCSPSGSPSILSIVNDHINKAFGNTTNFDHARERMQEIAGLDDTVSPCRPSLALVSGSWTNVHIASRPFIARHCTDVNSPEGAEKCVHDLQTLGDLHRALGAMQNDREVICLFFFVEGEADAETAAADESGSEDDERDEYKPQDGNERARKRESKMERRRAWEPRSKRQKYWEDLTVPCSRCSLNSYDEPDFSMEERRSERE